MTWTHPAFGAIADLVGVRTGLAFAPDRRPAVELGIRRSMQRAGVTDVERYRRRVGEDPLFDELVGELTIGETYFFREPAHFEFLRHTALVELRTRRGPDTRVRAWSAACASGEEAYSLAMLLAEEGLIEGSHLLATDISRAALERSRRATYGEWSLRGEGAAAARRHLGRVGDRYVVDESLCRRVTFEYLNLATEAYPSFATGTWGMDLIFCRNVLIYFDAETVRGVARRLFASLAEGGWLITGSSDPPLAGAAPFEMVATAQGVFYRRGSGPPPPPTIPANAAVGPLVVPEVGRPKLIDGSPRPAPTPGFAGRPPCPASSRGVPDRDEEAAALDAARADLAEGRYERAAERTRGRVDLAAACGVHVRALANLDLERAEAACAEAVRRHPLSGELHHLRAVLLMSLGRDDEAAQAARRALYVDRSLAIAHFTLGSILRRKGDPAGAWRAFRNARDLCAARPADEPVPLSDGELAGRLADEARIQMVQLGTSEEPRR
jgi:chemotaxis protein methyltransferase CheR